MAKLRDILRQTRNYSQRRFLNSRDMAEIKHYEAVTQARRNRGEHPNHPNEYICVCGCGFEGCAVHGSYETQTPQQQAESERLKDSYKEQDKKNQDRDLKVRRKRQARSKARIKAKQRKS